MPFNEILKERIDNLIVFRGGMGKKQLAVAHEKLDNISDKKSNLILATGRYLGEGFDHSHLDTLFLTLPVSMIEPAYMTLILWANSATTPRSWVIHMIAMPSSFCSFLTRSIIWA